MKKEKDAIKNSTKELTKTELVHKFQTAPLDLKFYGQVEEQHNQQILSRKKAQQREIETFKKSELGVIAKLQEVYDRECKNFENLEKKYKKGVSRNAMDEAAAELMHAKRLYEEKLKEKIQTSKKNSSRIYKKWKRIFSTWETSVSSPAHGISMKEDLIFTSLNSEIPDFLRNNFKKNMGIITNLVS